MAEILGLGLSHYPPLCLPDADMAGLLRWTLQDPSIPAIEKDVATWPAPMRAEWADDFGTRAAAEHRAQLVAGAMEELGARLEWSEFIETHIFNSNKVFAVYSQA